MKVFAKFILILATCAMCYSHYQSNVGSVLFTPIDLQKSQWTQNELALLRARKHFQNLIPLRFDSISDDYLSHLLKYADNCYKTIANEAVDPSEKELMTTALSDVIGGYLKVWILPITKYSYYGGSINPINAIKLFQLYDDIKQSLNTDGETWKNPNEELLQTVTINIASNPHEWYTRSIHESCDSLSYYEKTDKGLTVPLPSINWNIYPQTMFIPLKDQSLIQLNSPNSSNALLDYYNVATSCIHSLNSDTVDDFGSRFQIWLSTDVVPHLRDDDLYIACGSCLSLLNKTYNLYSNMVNLFDNSYKISPFKALSSCYPVPLTKKNILIAIVIFIEIIWCIPVIYYLLCVKKSSNNKNSVKHLFTFFRKDPKPLHGVRLFVKPRTRNLELDVEFPSYDQNYNMKSTSTNISKNNIYNNITHINESLTKYPSKPSVNNNVASHKNNQTDIIETLNQDTSCRCKRQCDNKASCYFTNSQIINNSSKTIDSYPGPPSSFMFLNENEIKNVSYTHATLSVSKSTIRSRCDGKVSSNMKSPDAILSTVKCPCVNCIKNSKVNSLQLQCLKNIEKSSVKVNNPIVMQLINDHKREEKKINLYKTEIQQKTVPDELNKKEKMLGHSVKVTENKNVKKISIEKNRVTVKEKVTLDKDKTSKTCKVVNDNLKSFKGRNGEPPLKDKKSLQTKKPREKVDNVVLKKSSRTNKFALVEVPKEHKIKQKVKSDMEKIAKIEDGEPETNQPKCEEKLLEISKQSNIPKPKVLNPGTTGSTEPYKKRFNSPSKPCKIPRRITPHLNDQKGSKKKEDISLKSLEFKSVKKTVDDTAIKKPSNDKTKLNTTL